MKIKRYVPVFLLVILLLSACGSPQEEPTEVQPAATEEPVVTEEVVPTEEPTEVPTNVPEDSDPAPIEGDAFVEISGSKFSESTLIIRVGTVVTWTNTSDNEHTVTSDDGVFNSSVSDGGGTFSFTFTEVGEFPYHCEIHRGMKAKIIVVE